MDKMAIEAQKPRVLVFTTAYAPFIGGAEVAVEQIAKRLKDKFEFFIITSRMRKDLPRREVRDEGTVIRIGFGTRFDKFWLLIFSWFIVLREFKLRKGKTIFWVMDFSFGASAAGLLKLIYPKIPLVFTIQYGESEERISKGRFGLMSPALRLILMQADYVTAISNYLLELCKQYGYIGEEAIIHNGVDLQRAGESLRFPRLASLAQGGLLAKPAQQLTGSPIIVTVSRLVPKNGVDILIQSVVELKKEIPDIKLRIVGDGPERGNLEHLSDSLGLKDNVKFSGSVPYGEVPKYLSEADVFARPSRSEGMGNAFIEALAAGLPIIGTPVGGITDIIDDQNTGLFVKTDDPKDLAEKIKILLNDKELAARIVANGHKIILERFDWDFIAKAYAQVFSKKLAVKSRVLIATGIFPPEVGGPATYSKILLEEFPKQDLGARVSTYGKSKKLNWFIRHALFGMRTFFMARNHDALYAQDAINSGMISMSSAFVWRKKFFVKIVGDYAWEQGTQRFGVREMLDDFLNRKYGRKVEILRKIQKFTAKRAGKIIVPSEYLKKVVSAWGINSDKIKVIYNAFEPDRSPTSITKELARAELGLEGKVLVSAGRLVPWKGFGLLIEIVKDLLISFPDIKLVIIGDGPDMGSLVHKAYGVRENIIFTGNLPRKKVLKYLVVGDVFALNTAYEGLSHQILEAMGLGVPIVTTDAGGNPELIKDGESGFLVKFNDKKALADRILKLLSDGALARQFAQNAKKKAQEFSLERMINETVKILTI